MMDANYLYVPQSVEAVTGLESVLTLQDINRSVLFRGVRLIKGGLQAKDGNASALPDDLADDAVLIMLYSELAPEDLDDMIDDHTRSAQQGYLIPVQALEVKEVDGQQIPLGTSDLLLPGTPGPETTYFALGANMDVARRHCRVNMLPEIIYDAEEAAERFLVLRRELELYLGYGVRKFTGYRVFTDLDSDKLMKAVRLVEIVTDEKFPKFRDCLFEPDFRQRFVELLMDDINAEELNEDGLIGRHRANDLFILFCLIRDLVGTKEWLDRLPDTVPKDLKQFLARIVLDR